MSARPSSDTQIRVYEIAIVGNDMLLAALPGRPVQLAHATLAAGYDLVVPVSWGEELLAEHMLRVLEHPGPIPLIVCACPLVRRRLLASGNEIVPHLLSTVAPPAATARYLRALQPDVAMRITYLGGCSGAHDTAIDQIIEPLDFLRHLEERAISVFRQPSVFEAMVPPDRRRHWSLPGGTPSRDAIRERGDTAHFLVVDGRDLASEIADHLIAGERALLDIAPTVGCACAGAVEVHQTQGSRDAVMALEPPRSPLPVIDVDMRITLEHPLPLLTARTGRGSGADAAGQGPGITSIHQAARARAERRRIAVTPPGIGSVGRFTARESRPPVPNGSTTSSAAAPIDVRSIPVAAEPAASPALPVPAPRTEPALTMSAPVSEAAPVRHERHPAAEPVVQIPSSTESHVQPRRKTPTYEMRHVARAAAHTKPGSGEFPRVPRAYSAVRPRTRADDSLTAIPDPVPVVPPVAGGVGPRVTGLIEEPRVSGVNRLETAAPITTVLEPPSARGRVNVNATELHQAAQRALRTKVRPLPPPEPSNPRQLWGLLASVVLIAAVSVLLFVIFS